MLSSHPHGRISGRDGRGLEKGWNEKQLKSSLVGTDMQVVLLSAAVEMGMNDGLD